MLLPLGSQGSFLPGSSVDCGRERAGNNEEEKGVRNFKCLTWDLHSLKRGHFINDRSFRSPGKGANEF